MLIEGWKVTKAVDIKIVPSAAGATLPYRLDIKGAAEVSLILHA